MNSLIFVTRNNNNFYKAEPGKTLLHFSEYDFTCFWEQCIALGQEFRKTGSYELRKISQVKNLIVKCHPYYEAQINGDFEAVVMDCIIEYICHSENIGLEELWARCISPKNVYEKAIFTRISEYKTNRGINQWANLMRMQEYVKTKAAYIFDGEPASRNEYRTRKGYFDLTFSVMAKELGFPSMELPSVKCYSPCLMPNAAFMLSKVSKGILRKISGIVDEAEEPEYAHIHGALKDQVGLDAFRYIKNITRPEEPEMKTAMAAFQGLSSAVYMPDSFKALIDLEFDMMIEEDVFLQKCEKCGKYFYQAMDYKGKFCNRVNASGKTCRELAEAEKPSEPIEEDLDERCQKIFNSMYQLVGSGMEEHEFKEWSQYLLNMEKNVEMECSTKEDLEAFLEYSEKMCSDIKQKQDITRVKKSGVQIPDVPKVTEEARPAPEPYHFPTLEELQRRDGF